MNVINIGILAHVDAGKTTITESMLYESGVINKRGKVDNGNTFTDNLDMEKQKGITIKESTVSFYWDNIKINLLDTPGHMDFISEVDRALSILDIAVLLISAKEGVQSQSIILYNQLKNLGIPTIIFVNKLDRLGSDLEKIYTELQERLNSKIIKIQNIDTDCDGNFNITPFNKKKSLLEENCLVLDEFNKNIFKEYCNNMFYEERMRNLIIELTNECKINPVLCGIASKDIGVKQLLDTITKLCVEKKYTSSGELSAFVYKILFDENGKKKVYIKVYRGQIRSRDKVKIQRNDYNLIIGILEKLENGKIKQVNKINAGDIAILTNVNELKIGDILGSNSTLIRKIKEAQSYLSVSIYPIKKHLRPDLLTALSKIREEDPSLQYRVDSKTNEIVVDLIGDIQKEYIKEVIEKRYRIECDFMNVSVIYKEQPLKFGECTILMGEKKNLYNASIMISIEPSEVEDGIIYESKVSYGYLSKSFQVAVHDGVMQGLLKGPLGWNITGTKVTFTGAYYDSVTSTPSDFRNLAAVVVEKAISSVGTQLLEPYLEFEIIIPEDACSKVLYDIEKMNGNIKEVNILGSNVSIIGKVPVRKAYGYSIRLASITKGTGVFSVRQAEYSVYKDK